jgi:hypothetical protein
MDVDGHLHALDTSSPGNEPWYTLERRLGGAQNRPGRCALPLQEIEARFLGHPDSSSVNILWLIIGLKMEEHRTLCGHLFGTYNGNITDYIIL